MKGQPARNPQSEPLSPELIKRILEMAEQATQSTQPETPEGITELLREEPGAPGQAGNVPQVERNPDIDCLAAAWLGRAADGYFRYYRGLLKRLTVAGAQLLSHAQPTQKYGWLQRLDRDRASCFWWALLLTCDRTELALFAQEYTSELVNPQDGVTARQALLIMRRFQVDLAQYEPNTGGLTVISQVGPQQRPNRDWRPLILEVYMDDHQQFGPHWLPSAGRGNGSAIMDDPEKRRLNIALGVEVASVPRPREPPTARSTVSIPPNMFTVLTDECPEAEDLDEPAPPPARIAQRNRPQPRRSPASSGRTTATSEASPSQRSTATRATTPEPSAEPPPEPIQTDGLGPSDYGTEHDAMGLPPPYFDGERPIGALRFCPIAIGHEAPPVVTRGPLGATTMWYEGKTAESAPMAVPQTGPHQAFVAKTVVMQQVWPSVKAAGIGLSAMLAMYCSERRGGLAAVTARSALKVVAAGLSWLHSEDFSSRVTVLKPVHLLTVPLTVFAAVFGARCLLGPLKALTRTTTLFGLAEALHYPRLVEARESVVLAHKLGEGDLLYVRDRPVNPARARRLQGGAYDLRVIDSLDCEQRTLRLGPVHIMQAHGRPYVVRKVLHARAAFSLPRAVFKRVVACLNRPMGYYLSGKLRWYGFTRSADCMEELARMIDRLAGKIVRGALFRHAVHGVRCGENKLPEIGYQAVSHLPTDDAKVRALYAMVKTVLPENLQGVFVDVRGPHLASANPLEHGVREIAEDLVHVNEAISACLLDLPAFSVPPRPDNRACQSCNRQPPQGPYRWRHRICNDCRAALKKTGAVTPAGRQLQMNLQVPTCHPGIVHFAPSQYPPPQKKWDEVRTAYLDKDGERCSTVKVCWKSAGVKQGYRNSGSKWDDFYKADMARLTERFDSRPKFALAGIACSGAVPMVSAKTAYNQAKALLGRMYRRQAPGPWGPGPRPGVWAHARKFVPLLLPGFTEDVKPMSFEQWLSSMPARRRKPLLAARVAYERRGLRPSDRNFKAFVKEELLPGFSQKLATGSGAVLRDDLFELLEMLDRLINGPADITHSVCGRYLKPYIHRLKEVWNVHFPIVYGSATPEVLHQFLQKLVARRAMYVEIDFSMFDATFSDDCVDFMEALYHTMCDDPDCQTILKWWRRPQGFIGPFKYKLDRTVNASGRDDTALMNGILNGIATTLSFAAAFHRVDLLELTVQQVKEFLPYMDLSVCGDDSLAALPPLVGEQRAQFADAVERNIRMFGFEAKMAVHDDICDATYLGKMAHPTTKGWFWGPTPGRCSYKWPYIKRPEGRDVMADLTGIAEMHAQCSSVSPIMYELARKVLQLRQGAKVNRQQLDPERPWEWSYVSGVKYDQLTVEALAARYTRKSGSEVSASDIWRLIEKIRGVQQLPCVLDDHTWRLLIATDDL